MLISTNWIRDFVDLDGLDLDALIHRFTLSTAEVEEVYHKGDDLKDVVAGKILSVENHPDSKKLHLLKVDTGDQTVDCVCGAPNVREGMIVPFVKAGGMVGGQTIGVAKLAGYPSCGMCCSAAELGISDDHSGLMELPADTPVGADLTTLYPIRDVVFEVDNKSLTNRPDLWGHYGIAREFAALTGRALKPAPAEELGQYDALPEIPISVEDDLCYRYTGLRVDNVTVKQSPIWIQIRLYYCGSRAINLLADLTNYLMMELGQPMHAFDSAKVDKIEVHRPPQEMDFVTLDGQTRRVDPDTLLIYSGGEPVAIAGVMGGLASEIEEDTTSLLLESANFDGVSVRKTSTRLGLRTDASMRYEKVLDPEMTVPAIARFLYLLHEVDKGAAVISRLTDHYRRRYDTVVLTFDKAYVDRYTGIDISPAQIVKTLTALDFTVVQNGDSFTVTVPSHRATKDVTIPADIIEEITRIYGYDNFEVHSTRSLLAPVKPSRAKREENLIKDMLVRQFGLHEVHSYIWWDAKKNRELGIAPEENVRLLNAMTPEHAVIRNNMIPTLLCMLKENKGFAPDYGIFEIARVVEGLKENGECNEKKKLGITLISRTRSERALYFRLRDMLAALADDCKHAPLVFSPAAPTHSWQHPRNTAALSLAGQELGFLCTLHPANLEKLDKKAAVVCAQIDLDDFAAITPNELQYSEPSRYPAIEADLTLLMPNGVWYADAAKCLERVNCPVLESVRPIDLYEDALGRSLTVRFRFSDRERTLSREEVEPYLDSFLDALRHHGICMK